MVKINNVISLLVAASFSLVAAKPFESNYCKELEAYLNTKNASLALCDPVSDGEDLSTVLIKSSTIDQGIIDKINTYDGVLDFITFENVSSVQKNLNLSSLKTNALYFDNKHYNGDKKEIYIPKNVLKGAKQLDTLSLYGFNLSQRNLDEISSLTNLKELYLDSCTVDANIDFSKLKNLKKNLTTLVFSTIRQKGKEERLGEVPESICQLKKLNYLCLYRNGLTTIPECIANLKHLEKLDLRINNIESIPRAVRKMKNLEILYEE